MRWVNLQEIGRQVTCGFVLVYTSGSLVQVGS